MRIDIAKIFLARLLALALFSASPWALSAQTVEVQIYENVTVFPGESRFFMTARDADKAFLVSHPEMQWQPLYTFAAYAAAAAPAASVAVCRFFLPTLATHFYTADAAECARFKRDALFVFEGEDFRVTLPNVGVCAEAEVPLYRAYNDGPKRGVSGNHLFGPDVGLTNYLSRFAGWVKEGVVMCGPKAAADAALVVTGGRATPAHDETLLAEAPGLPIAQIINAKTLSSVTWPDPLRGESDWQSRSAFDAIRGKLYLVRATTLRTRIAFDLTITGPSTPLSRPLKVVEPTRDHDNVMELDIKTGQARYLDVPGTFTDVHFNADRRLLLLAGPDAAGQGRLLWFDPARNIAVKQISTAVPAFTVQVKYFGNAACEYRVNSQTYIDYFFWPQYQVIAIPALACVGTDDVLRFQGKPEKADASTEAFGYGAGCALGDMLYAFFYENQRNIQRFRLSDMSAVGALPRADFSFATAEPNQYRHYQTQSCFVRDKDLYVLLFATYGDKTAGYFMLRYRDDRLLERIGPLTEAEHIFANTPFESWQGRPPTYLSGSDIQTVPRSTAAPSELWVLVPQDSQRASVVRRVDAAAFTELGAITLALSGRQLHVKP